jgi:archaemetzincin
MSVRVVRILDGSRRFGVSADLARRVGTHLGATVELRPWHPALDRAFDPSRGQHNATALLDQVVRSSDDAVRRIGVVDVDLFVPVLTFVFGQAMLGGAGGIVSTARLANEFYGLPRDDRRLEERLEKELVHEIGHLLGLVHCRQFECVMRSSTYVEEIDLKRSTLCLQCSGLIEH